MADAAGVRRDSMAPEVARRLASVVQPDRRTEPGDALPALWQWGYFPGTEPMGGLSPDGHLRRDDEWAQRYPQRMAGGGSIKRSAQFVIGEPAERRSELLRAEERDGRSGELVICDWRHTYVQGDRSVLDEVQTVIYRAPNSSRGSVATVPNDRPSGAHQDGDAQEDALRRTGEPAHARWVLTRRLEFDPVLLFRFSAATWNSHRIHFDRPYATMVEGYPGLLVHGPLLAMLLAQEAEGVLGEPDAMEFRSHAPVFDVDAVDVYVLRTGDGSCRVEARKADGAVTTSLSATTTGR